MIDIEAKTIKPLDTTADAFDWKHYFHLSTINAWLEKIAAENSFISLVELGKSYEGNTVKGIKFAKKEGNPCIFIESGIHAREWIAPAVTTFVINQLITSDSKLRFFINLRFGCG